MERLISAGLCTELPGLGKITPGFLVLVQPEAKKEVFKQMSNTQKAIDRVCEYRGVKFDDTSKVFNCHPSYNMKIFSINGDVIHQSDEV